MTAVQSSRGSLGLSGRGNPEWTGASESDSLPNASHSRETCQKPLLVQVKQPSGLSQSTEGAKRDTVYVRRIGEDISHERGLNLWIVSDNIRKGAATNSVQIAEILVREHI